MGGGNMTRTALLLDGRAISTLAAARQLDSVGFSVHVAEEFRGNLTACSSASVASHTYPSPEERSEAFSERVRELAADIQPEILIPARDETTRLVASLSDQLAHSTRTLLDSPGQIEQFQDKAKTAELARAAGVPIPKTYDPTEIDIADIRDRAEFPVVIKPTKASGARGIRRVEDSTALVETYREATAEGEPVIIQEFVDHSGGHYSIGTVFGSEGRPRALHVYEELLQYPDSGGPAIRARSHPAEPWVYDMLALLESVGWTGPAHIDVLYDPADDTYKLLEVNPRLWSSLALTIASGVDVPTVITETATGDGPEGPTAYNTGRSYRWLLPNEILWAVDGWNTPNRIAHLLQQPGPATTYSILSRHDPGAILGTAVQSARFLLDAEKRQQVLGRGLDDNHSPKIETTHERQQPQTRQ